MGARTDGKGGTADAAKAAEEMLKAKEEIAKAKDEAAKAALEVQTADLNREKAELALTEAKSATSEERRKAEDDKAVAVAKQEGAEARQKQVAALIPDVSKIKGGELEVTDGPVLFGPTLTQRALASAATEVGTACLTVLEKREEPWRLLVTADADLASSDAVYQDVLSGIAQMHNALKPLLPAPSPPPPPEGFGVVDFTISDQVRMARLLGPTTVAGISAAVTVLPDLISLLLPRRTLSSSALSVDGTSATAAAIGALKAKAAPRSGETIVHDGFRLLPDGGVVLDKLAELETRRGEVAGHRITLEAVRTTATARVAECEATIKALGKELEKATGNAKDDLERCLRDEQGDLVEHREKASAAATRIGLIESALVAADEFINALRTTPTGSRSPLATALLREQLHSGGEAPAKFTHVLLIEADEGAAHQVLDDRPLFLADRVSIVGAVNVSYMLIEVGTSAVKAAGVASGSSTLAGKVGRNLASGESKRPTWGFPALRRRRARR